MSERLESEEKKALERQALLEPQGAKPEKSKKKKKRNRQEEKRKQEKAQRTSGQIIPTPEVKEEQTEEMPPIYRDFLRFVQNEKKENSHGCKVYGFQMVKFE